MRRMNEPQRPSIDPTMHVYCRIHSEMPGHDGGRKGPVAATWVRDDGYGRGGYVCWHCADLEWRTVKLSDREAESLSGEF